MGLAPVVNKESLCEQEVYWKAVPGRVRPKLHYYNTFIPPDKSHADNPASIIRNIYRPGAV